MAGFLRLEDAQSEITRRLEDYGRQLFRVGGPPDPEEENDQVVQRLTRTGLQLIEQAAPLAPPQLQPITRAPEVARTIQQGAQHAVQRLQPLEPATPPQSGPAVARGGDLRAYARQAAQKAGIDPDVFERQIQQESGFRTEARSPAGASGIAQIVPKYHPGVDTSDPYASLDYASNLMRAHLAKYGGDYSKALAAYNAGAGAVDRYGGIPPFEETQRYVSTILGGAKRQLQQAVQPFVQGAQVVGAALQPGEEPPTQPQPSPSADKWKTSFDFASTYTGNYRTGTPHRGIDLVPQKGGIGTAVEAFHPGTVTNISRDSGAGGLMVFVRDEQGLTHAYMHLQGTAPGLAVGQRVERGQQIARMGESGTEGSPHLHYEVRRNAATGDALNQLIDPRPYMTGQHGPESGATAAAAPLTMGQMQPGPPDTKTLTRPLEDLGAGVQQLGQGGLQLIDMARQQLRSPELQGMIQRAQPGGTPMTPERAREVRTELEQVPGVQGGMGLIEAFRQTPAANVLGTAARTVLTPQGPLEALGVTPQQARGMILGPAAISDEDLLATASTDEIENARRNFRSVWKREPNQAQTLEQIRGARLGMAYAGERGQPPVGRTPEGQITMGAGTTGISQTPSFLRESLRRMYPGAINKAAVKEAVQNSVDASRGIPGATTYVKVDNPSKTVSIVDQGKGMSPQTMESVFVRLGGSDKPAGASGGMGTAIKAVMANGEETWVRSIGRDPASGQLTDSIMHGSSDDFLGGTMHRYYARYGEMPEAELAGAPPEVEALGYGPATTGTALWTKPLPDASWSPYTLLSWVNSFNHLNRVGDQRVQFTVDGQVLDPSNRYQQWDEAHPPQGSAVNQDDLPTELIQTINTPGAQIDLYGSRNVSESSSSTVHLLNQGQYQADMHVYLDGNAKLPTTLSADIRPTVGARDVGYPWTADRNALVDVDAQGLKDFVKNDLAVAAVAKENKRVADSIADAPMIKSSGGMRLVDDAEVGKWQSGADALQKVTQAPHYTRLTRAIEDLHNSLSAELQGREVFGQEVGPSRLIGLGVSEKWLGLNLPPSFTPWGQSGDVAKGILVNPWQIWHEVEVNWPGATRAEHLERFNEYLLGTMTHEIAHNTSIRGHEEGFAGILTRIPSFLGTSMRNAVTTQLKRSLTPVWDTLADDLSHDASTFRTYGGAAQSGISRFGEESGVGAQPRGAGPDILAGPPAGGIEGGPLGGGAPDYRGGGGPGYPSGAPARDLGAARAPFAAGLGGLAAGGAGLYAAAQQGFLSPVTERAQEIGRGALEGARGLLDPGMLQRMVQGGSATPEETRQNLEALNALRREAFPSILDPNHPSAVIPEMQAKYPGRTPGSVDESAMTPEERERWLNAQLVVGGMSLSSAGGTGIGRLSRAALQQEPGATSAASRMFHYTPAGDFDVFETGRRGLVYLAESPMQALEGAQAGWRENVRRSAGIPTRVREERGRLLRVDVAPETRVFQDDWPARFTSAEYDAALDRFIAAKEGASPEVKRAIDELRNITVGRAGRTVGDAIEYNDVPRALSHTQAETPAMQEALRRLGYEATHVADEAGRSLAVLEPSRLNIAARVPARSDPIFAARAASTVGGGAAGWATTPEGATLEERLKRTAVGAGAGFVGGGLATAPFNRAIVDQAVLSRLRQSGLATGPGRTPPKGMIGVATDLTKQGMLTNPLTHIGNMVGNTIEILRQPTALALGGSFDEAAASTTAAVRAMPEAWNNMVAVLRSGRQAATLGTEAQQQGKAQPVFRLLGAMDIFTRTIGEYQGMAAKGASMLKQAGLKPGTAQADQFLATHADELYDAGARAGSTGVFGAERHTARGGMPILDQWMSSLARWKDEAFASGNTRRRAVAALLDTQLPFTGVPTRILQVGIGRLPGVAQGAGVYRMINAARKGDRLGAQRALGETVLETAIQMKIAEAIADGNITGPEDLEHPSSVQIAGQWVPLRQLGAYGLPMAIMAAWAEGWEKAGNEPDADTRDRFAAALNATGKPLWDAVPGSNFVDLLSAVGRGGVTAGGATLARDLINRALAPSAVKVIADATDPVARDIQRDGPEMLWESPMARWPGLSRFLPEKIDPTTGQPLPRQRQGLAGLIGGALEESVPENQLRKEIESLRGEGFTDISQMKNYPESITVAGGEIPLSPDEQRAVTRITGQLLGDLSARLSAPSYQNASPERKALTIRAMQTAASRARATALREVIGAAELRRRALAGRRIAGRLVDQPEDEAIINLSESLSAAEQRARELVGAGGR